MSRFRNSARKSPVSVITTVLAMLGIAIVAPALTMTSANAVSPVTVVVHVTDAVNTKSVTIKNSAGSSTLATETAAYADDYGSFAVLTLTAGTETVQISASGYTARGEVSNVKANPEVWIDADGYVRTLHSKQTIVRLLFITLQRAMPMPRVQDFVTVATADQKSQLLQVKVHP